MMARDWEELPRKFTPALKKRVSKDWHGYFPSFAEIKPLFFKRRVGCLSVSLYLDISRGSEDYTPYYCVHNLSRELDFMSATLSVSSFRPTSMKIRWHDKNYKEFTLKMREKAYLPLEGPISLQDMVKAYQDYQVNYPYPHPMPHIQDPALICAWAGEEALAQECLAWGLEVLKSWPEAKQAAQGGVEAWHDKMLGLIADPQKLRQIARDQVILHKLTKVPYQDFCDASYRELS
jgi:hypothetical protein